MHIRDRTKRHYEFSELSSVLCGQYPEILEQKDLHQGLNWVFCSTWKCVALPSTLPLKLPSKGTCAAWRQPSLSSFWSLGLMPSPFLRGALPGPGPEYPHTYHPASPTCPYPAPAPAVSSRHSHGFVAKYDSPLWFLYQLPNGVRRIFLNTKLTCHFPAKSSMTLSHP